MKKVLFLLLLFTGMKAGAQTLVINDETADVNFVTKYLGGRLEGNFKGVQGTSQFNPAQLSASYFKLVFAVATATTTDNLAGPNLIQEECFYPAKYPNIELFSTSITTLDAANKYQFTGTLKVKGRTKIISFPFNAVANAGGYDFNFSFGIRRKDFDLKCTALGKDIRIIVRAYAKKL